MAVDSSHTDVEPVAGASVAPLCEENAERSMANAWLRGRWFSLALPLEDWMKLFAGDRQ
jgi:hypothetical protein